MTFQDLLRATEPSTAPTSRCNCGGTRCENLRALLFRTRGRALRRPRLREAAQGKIALGFLSPFCSANLGAGQTRRLLPRTARNPEPEIAQVSCPEEEIWRCVSGATTEKARYGIAKCAVIAHASAFQSKLRCPQHEQFVPSLEAEASP